MRRRRRRPRRPRRARRRSGPTATKEPSRAIIEQGAQRRETGAGILRVMRAATDDVLGRRALNRALLARQLLLRRHDVTVPAALEHLLGLQAQAPRPPYYGLWSRIEGFDPNALGWMLTERDAVRLTLMRGTVHLV